MWLTLNLCFNISSYSVSGAEHVTLVDPATKADIGRDLINDGFLIAEKNKKDRRLQKLVSFPLVFVRIVNAKSIMKKVTWFLGLSV